MEHGPLTGSYARDVRVVVYDGKMHPVDSNELSFTLAARHAFSMAFKEAGPKILEPIYDLEVYVPSDYMGDVMSCKAVVPSSWVWMLRQAIRNSVPRYL